MLVTAVPTSSADFVLRYHSNLTTTLQSTSASVRLPSFCGQNCGVQARIETEDHAMSLIRNRRGFLGALFSALLALALFDPGAATAQQVKQIKLTEKHIQGFMAAYDDIAKLYYGANPDKGIRRSTRRPRNSPSRPNRSRMKSRRSRPTNPYRRRKRKRAWRSSRRRSRSQNPFNSRKTSRWC